MFIIITLTEAEELVGILLQMQPEICLCSEHTNQLHKWSNTMLSLGHTQKYSQIETQ